MTSTPGASTDRTAGPRRRRSGSARGSTGEGLSTDALWAYGDSAGDVAMLAMAPFPVWVTEAPLAVVPAVVA